MSASATASLAGGSLDGWLGRSKGPTDPVSARTPVKMDPRALSPVRMPGSAPDPTRIVFGVLGTRNKMSYEDFVSQILDPTVEAWGLPAEIIAPADGESAEVLQAWATHRCIPICLVAADWTRNGKRAGMLRDSRIQRDASHLILLQGPRSNALTALAGRLQRKGRPVVLSERPGVSVAVPDILALSN
jgi:hypothetical protein